MREAQKSLAQEQLESFYHDNFVESQVRDFLELVRPPIDPDSDVVVDIGGGLGFFAKAVQERLSVKVRVLETDPQSIDKCRKAGVDARMDNALEPTILGDESVVCFNLILHHLVGATPHETLQLQARALAAWRPHARAIFVNEYVYESFVFDEFSGAIIYQITRSRALSLLGRLIAKFAPSLKANTFGVGVRFRSNAGWRQMFSSLGFDVMGCVTGSEEHVSLPRRLLLIKSCRRDSFLLIRKPPLHGA